jgi:hypothetical protein
MESMQTKSKIARLLTTSSIALFLMAVSSELIAQEKNSAYLKAFKITIENTDNGIKMQSDKGSAWVELSFSLSNNKSQAIDEYGMTELGQPATNKDPKLADYLITITKTKEGITLTGIDGTAWKELSFSLKKNSKQTIDQFGMSN